MTEQETRDLFAAHALAALISKEVGDMAWTARLAYGYADSMMLKRASDIRERQGAT